MRGSRELCRRDPRILIPGLASTTIVHVRRCGQCTTLNGKTSASTSHDFEGASMSAFGLQIHVPRITPVHPRRHHRWFNITSVTTILCTPSFCQVTSYVFIAYRQEESAKRGDSGTKSGKGRRIAHQCL